MPSSGVEAYLTRTWLLQIKKRLHTCDAAVTVSHCLTSSVHRVLWQVGAAEATYGTARGGAHCLRVRSDKKAGRLRMAPPASFVMKHFRAIVDKHAIFGMLYII